MTKIFGTDGVRGIVNKDLDIFLLTKLALAGGIYFKKENLDTILIAKDTRLSSDMIEHLFAGILSSLGYKVRLLGVLPTPVLSYLTTTGNYAGSIMISASHNPYQFNGIKFFKKDGFKLKRNQEDEIEEIFYSLDNNKIRQFFAIPDKIGKIFFDNNLRYDYINFIDSIKPEKLNLKVVIDTANGATYKLAKEIFSKINDKNIFIFDKPDGLNINRDCGATYLDSLKHFVLEYKADLGIAYDGDADRVIFVDKKLNIKDGDTLLYLLSIYYKKKELLKNNCIVSTVMSNMALEKALKRENISMLRAKVGDINVLEMMLENNCIIGGEQSGHIILLNHAKTGDGILTSIEVIKALKYLNLDLSDINLKNFPQKLVNIKVEDKSEIMKNPHLHLEIKRLENMYKNDIRIVVRPSGTEPVIRVMVEAVRQDLLQEVLDNIVKIIKTGGKY